MEASFNEMDSNLEGRHTGGVCFCVSFFLLVETLQVNVSDTEHEITFHLHFASSPSQSGVGVETCYFPLRR